MKTDKNNTDNSQVAVNLTAKGPRLTKPSPKKLKRVRARRAQKITRRQKYRG